MVIRDRSLTDMTASVRLYYFSTELQVSPLQDLHATGNTYVKAVMKPMVDGMVPVSVLNAKLKSLAGAAPPGPGPERE